MAAMRKSTIGVLISLLSVGCGDPSDDKHDDAPESEQAARGGGLYSVTFAVKANPESLGSASVSIFNALGETCAGKSCKAYPLNQAYFQATPNGSARFVGWSGCSFVGLGHFSAATFLENVGVLDETCTANFADATGTTPAPTEPSTFPTIPGPSFPASEPDDRVRPIAEQPGAEEPAEAPTEEVTPGKTKPTKTPSKTPPADGEEADDGANEVPTDGKPADGGKKADGVNKAPPGTVTPKPGTNTPDKTPPVADDEESDDGTAETPPQVPEGKADGKQEAPSGFSWPTTTP